MLIQILWGGRRYQFTSVEEARAHGFQLTTEEIKRDTALPGNTTALLPPQQEAGSKSPDQQAKGAAR